MTSYNNALEYEDNHLKSFGKSLKTAPSLWKQRKKMLRNDYSSEGHVGFKARIGIS